MSKHPLNAWMQAGYTADDTPPDMLKDFSQRIRALEATMERIAALCQLPLDYEAQLTAIKKLTDEVLGD